MKTTARARIIALLLAVIAAFTATLTLTACQQQPQNTSKPEASLKKEDVQKYQGAHFVVRYTNDEYGFAEEFTVYDSNGKVYVYTNTTGHPMVEGEEDLREGFIEKMREKGTEVTGSKKYKTEQTINEAWLEAIQADFNAEQTKPEKDDDAFGNRDYYVFDTDGNPHWIMRTGEKSSQLKDEHVSAAKGALIGD